MARLEALVTPSVMRWAREQARLSLDDASSKIKRPPEEIVAWEEGRSRPSIAQARTASQVYRRPLAVFYLPEPSSASILILAGLAAMGRRRRIRSR